MHKKPLVILAWTLFLVSAAGCGPSPEGVATMTAAAWTATPAPTATLTPTPPPTETPTPTPVPYGLTVRVVDEAGDPVAGAQVFLAETGEEEPARTDESGSVVWSDLPGAEGSLAVSAQGYNPQEQTIVLERGPNEIVVTLTSYPFALLPSRACAPGEVYVYAEDYQDGSSFQFKDMEFGPPGWRIGDDPEVEGNLVLAAAMEGSDLPIGMAARYWFRTNHVLRFRFYLSGAASLAFEAGAADNPPMGIMVNITANQVDVNSQDAQIAKSFSGATPDAWHMLELSSYDSVLEIWLDGQQVISTERAVLGDKVGSFIYLMPYLANAKSAMSLDDFSICGLNAPFRSIVAGEP
jgi:hypothetical protein